MKNQGGALLIVIILISLFFLIQAKLQSNREQEISAKIGQKMCEESALAFYSREIAGTSTYLATARWDSFRYACYLDLVGTSTKLIYRVENGGMLGELE